MKSSLLSAQAGWARFTAPGIRDSTEASLLRFSPTISQTALEFANVSSVKRVPSQAANRPDSCPFCEIMQMAAVCILSAFVALGAVAQTTEGRLWGTVSDPQGKVIAGAKVIVTNVDTGVFRTVAATQTGDYLAANLPPGRYSVSAEANGFKKIEKTGFRLEVAKDVRVDLQLDVGAVTDVVRVIGEVPLIETTKDTIGGTLMNKAINDLPLNGRDYQNLIVLRPGVVRYPGGGFGSIAADGVRPEDNNFIIDGSDDNDPYYSGNVINAEGVSGTPGSILPIDAIQEFNTEENLPAEYGRKPGVTVNIGLKSGTNELHGTAYYFGRNNALDARNFFDPGPGPQNALRQDQFGGTIGGAIKPKKSSSLAPMKACADLSATPISYSLPPPSAFPTTREAAPPRV